MVKITFKNQADLAITCADCLCLLYQDSAQDALEDDLRTVCQLIASKKAAKRWFCVVSVFTIQLMRYLVVCEENCRSLKTGARYAQKMLF